MKFTVIIVSFLGMNLEFSKYLSWILISMLYYFILSDQDETKVLQMNILKVLYV